MINHNNHTTTTNNNNDNDNNTNINNNNDNNDKCYVMLPGGGAALGVCRRRFERRSGDPNALVCELSVCKMAAWGYGISPRESNRIGKISLQRSQDFDICLTAGLPSGRRRTAPGAGGSDVL